MKIQARIVPLLLVLSMALSACSGADATATAPADTAESAAVPTAAGSAVVDVAAEDTDAAWDEANATVIALADSGSTVTGAGKAAVSGSTVTITGAGTYVLTGSLSDGQVVVKAGKKETVRLVLNGVDIASGENAPIYCASADKLIITLAEGTENTLTDAESYTYADAAAEEPDAALFSKCDLTLNGGGVLTVQARFNNGIGSKDDLVIAGGVYAITAANHGIRGRDSVTVVDGDFAIQAGSDGIQSNNDSGEDKGWIRLEGGTYRITSAHDGVQAETTLAITGGDFTIAAGGGHQATPAVSDDPDASDSYKGIKAGGEVAISGGTLVIDSADDAIHSNADVRISGGDFTLTTGDDAVHADGDLTIEDGALAIPACYEGLEGMTITLAGGTVDLTASDDGINAAGGNDSNGGGRFGRDSFAGMGEDSAIVDAEHWLRITGGRVTITAAGDGIDSNGNVEMSGGEVYIHGPVSGGDGALDYDGTFTLSGGVLAAAGSAGMAQAPGNASTQPSLLLYYTAAQPGGTLVELRDSAGNTLVSFTPERDFQTIVLSAPEMTDAQTYTVATGGQTLDVTLSGAVTALSDTGEAVTMGGMGGGFGGGRGSMDGTMPEGMVPGERPTGDFPGGERPTGERPAGRTPPGSPPGGAQPTTDPEAAA